MKNKGKILFSDVDGTLMTNEGVISIENCNAVQNFMAHGGLFTIATGRGLSSSRRLATMLGVNAPAIIYNGAVIYDFEKDVPLSIAYLPESSRELTKRSKEKFPNLRITICTLTENVEVGAYVVLTNPNYDCRYGGIDTVTDPWIKVVYHLPKEDMPMVDAFLRQHCSNDLAITASGDHYVEILSSISNKGDALKKFIGLYPNLITYAIGDYHNDRELLLAANHSACPNQAVEEIKSIADYVVAPVQQSAVADYIRIIEDEIQ